MPTSISELTPYYILLGLTHLGSEASIYNITLELWLFVLQGCKYCVVCKNVKYIVLLQCKYILMYVINDDIDLNLIMVLYFQP